MEDNILGEDMAEVMELFTEVIDSNEKMLMSDNSGSSWIEEVLDKGDNREVFAEGLKILADTEGEEHY